MIATFKDYWRRMLPDNAPVAGWITLGLRRLYVLPTRFGLVFLGMLGFMFSGAVNYNLSLGYALLFWLTSIMLISALHANLNLASLRLAASVQRNAFAGDLLPLSITLKQDKPQSRPSLTLRQNDYKTDFHFPADTLEISSIVSIPTQQRGWFKPGRLQLQTLYPLGLFRCWTVLDFGLETLIYPTPEANPPELPRDALTPQAGERWVNGEDEFFGLRDWNPSDAPRMIAWRQSARNDRLLSRVLQTQQGSQLWLDWHTLPNQLSTEARLSRLCSWVLKAEALGLNYGLRLPNLEYAPGLGPTHQEKCLAALALY